MAQYIYLPDITIDDINELASQGWFLESAIKIESESADRFDVILGKTTTELIRNETTGAEFFIDETVSYGDILLISFLMLFLIFGIMKFVLDFFIPKRVNFKR